MGLFTLFNIVSPIPPAKFQEQLSGLLEPLGLTAVETRERDDGSQLVLLDRPDPPLQLGVWVIPIGEGQFQPAEFDEQGKDQKWVESIRTICKVGATENDQPAELVLLALRLSAGLAEEGRIYDLHAGQSRDPAEALALVEAPFNIRSFVSYHYLAPPTGEAERSWLHLHGMAKFFCPDFEAFDVHPDVSHKALALLMHLADEASQGRQAPVGEPQPYGYGSFQLVPGEEARARLEAFSAEDFDPDHTTPSLAVEDAGAFQSLDKLLRGAYELEPKTREECRAEQRVWQARLEHIRRAYNRPELELIVRAALEVGADKNVEHIWVSIKSWSGATIAGELLNDAFADPKMVRGMPVNFNERLISGVSVLEEDAVLDEVETLRVLHRSATDVLDQVLDPPAVPPQTQELPSEDGQVVARFEDDGQVGALHLVSAESGQALIDPIWLYNRQSTPPILDMRRLSRLGRPPLLSEVYTAQRHPSEAPRASKMRLAWEGERVRLTLGDSVWAIVDLAQRRGWSRLITLSSRFGRPLSELETTTSTAPESPEQQAGTVE